MSLLKKPSVLALIFVICFSLVFVNVFKNWSQYNTNFTYDVAQYYAYLPAYFYNNGSMNFHNDMDHFLIKSQQGEFTTKVTYGMSILYSPFFLLAHKIAINQHSPLNGFSEPYQTCIHWGSIFYSLLGLFFLRLFLRKYFNDLIVAITLVLVFFGTNLFAYSYSYSEMTHCYLFMLFSAVLCLATTFYEKPTTLKFILLGILFGIISLVRPADVIFFGIFFLWDVSSLKDLKERFLFFLTNYRTLIVAIIVILLWIPQCLYWKDVNGSYIFFSYGGESFFWTDPQILNILFSYRKGLLLYSPMLIFAIIGFVFMKKNEFKNKYFFMAILVLITYVYSCWWDWAFGGGFAGRSFVAYISLLSVPMAFFLRKLFSVSGNNYIAGAKVLVFSAMFYLVCLNIFQTYQQVNLIIHYNGMNKETYWRVFGKVNLDDRDREFMNQHIKEPNYGEWYSGCNRNK